MKRLIIFIGHPAAGKTTAAHDLAAKLGDAKVIEVDRIKMRISGSVFGRDDREREKWFRAINREILAGLAKFENVIVDEGFFARKYYDKILRGIDRTGLKIFTVEMTFDFKEHLCRHECRNGGPDLNHSVKRMYDLWQSVPAAEKISANLEIHDAAMTTDEISALICQHLEK